MGTILHDCPQHKFGHAEIVLSSHGPILIYQISSKCTRILVDIQGKMPTDMNKFMKEEILPELPGKKINLFLHYFFIPTIFLLLKMSYRDVLKKQSRWKDFGLCQTAFYQLL